MNETTTSYAALALQLATRCVNGCKDKASARQVMADELDAIEKKVLGSKAFVRQFTGTDVGLVVLPEYFLTGFPMGETTAEWSEKAALDIDGPEYDRLGAIAQKANIHLAGNVYENDPHFPELFFQTCFVIAPSGSVVLRYRRMISLSTPSPFDVWDKYLDIYGKDAIFPVADTAIGKIAGIASEEILYPEIARCHAMKGAEVFVHSTSEVGSPALTPKDIAKRARAIENLAYVVSANSASLTHIPIPAASSSGMSKVVDFAGKVLAEAGVGGESMAAQATIDLAALRAVRRRTGLTNTLVRHPFQAYADTFAATVFKPANQLLGDGGAVRPPERGELQRRQAEDIERLSQAGII